MCKGRGGQAGHSLHYREGRGGILSGRGHQGRVEGVAGEWEEACQVSLYIEISCRLMREGEGSYLDAGPDCAYHGEHLAAHVVLQVLHASPHCCQLMLHEGLMHAKAQQHCITGSMK